MLASPYPACAVRSGGPALEGEGILINATPAGMNEDDPLPVPEARLPASLTVVDIVPRRDGTRLLALARACGCRTVAGGAMVEGQAEAMLDFFGLGGPVSAP